MNRKLIGLALLSVALGGCSLLGQQTKEAAETVHDAETAVKWRVGQFDGVRDEVSGDLVHVFCKREECTVSQKTLTMATSRQVSFDGKAKAPRKTADSTAREERLFTIPFDYNKSSINTKGMRVLGEAAQSLADAKKLRVVGLADSLNRDEYNLALAKKRAIAVQSWLQKKFGEMGKTVEVESDARLVKVTEEGVYPPGEQFKGRRVDLTVIVVEVK